MQIDLNGHIRIRSSDSMLVRLLIMQLKIDSMTPSIKNNRKCLYAMFRWTDYCQLIKGRIKGPHTSLEFFLYNYRFGIWKFVC